MKKILDYLKTLNVKVWILVVLLCLQVATCTKSCNSSRTIKKYQKELIQKNQEIDSITTLKNDSIWTLNKKIEILQTETKGLEKTLQIQGEAINQITEAKKNINVVVKQKKQ